MQKRQLQAYVCHNHKLFASICLYAHTHTHTHTQ
jgi:hypothetical protein